MVNLTATLSALITANHILHYHTVLDAFGHISVRSPINNATFFIALQMGPAVVSGLADIGEYLIEDGSPVNGTQGGYSERYIHSEILKRYPDVNAVVHSHAEDVLPYTLLDGGGSVFEATYHMAGFLGPYTPNFDISTLYRPTDPHDLLVNSPRFGAALAAHFGVNASHPTAPLHSVVLQRGHGFVVVARDVQQVVDFAYYAASNARVQTRAVGLAAAAAAAVGGGQDVGGLRYLSERERRDCRDMNAWIAFKPWEQWGWEVERSGGYVNELR